MWNGTVILGIFLKKLNTELPDDPAILLLGVYTQEKWKHMSSQKKNLCIFLFLTALFIVC